MRLIALTFIVLIEMAFVFIFVKLHMKVIHSMEMQRNRFWIAVRAYVSWLVFALVIVPVGMYIPFWANRRVGAIEINENSTLALLLLGIIGVLLTTVAGFRTRTR